MRINSSDTLCGYPILDIRKLLKRVQSVDFSRRRVQKILNINKENAQQLIEELENKYLIKKGEKFEFTESWTTTDQGNRLALASAAKPIKRETATKRIKELLARVVQANEKPEFIYFVTKVVLFGSYLSGKERINDVDVAIELTPKVEDHQALVEQILERADKAAQNGRSFSNFFKQLNWAEDEIVLYLKSGSRSLSLHSIDDEILEQTEKEIIFEAA